MPATLVLRGVRSPRTKASSVTCSARPPSQAFQFRVSVTISAAQSTSTNSGVACLSHGQRAFGEGAACSCGTPGADAGVGAGDGAGLAAEAAVMFVLLGKSVYFPAVIRQPGTCRKSVCIEMPEQEEGVTSRRAGSTSAGSSSFA